MTLADAEFGKTYKVTEIDTDDDEFKGFLSSLGCFVGSEITVVSIISKSYVVSIRDSRYNIDEDVAQAIKIG